MAEDLTFTCPAHIYRHSHDDNKRTRLLKEVLRSTISLQEQEMKNKSRGLGGFSGQVPPPARGTRRQRRKATQTAMMGDMNLDFVLSAEMDEMCLAMVGDEADNGGTPLSSLLRGCGERITRCASDLQEASRTLRQAQSETKLSRDMFDQDEVRFADRKEGSTPEVRAQNERVIYDFVAKHNRYKALDDLQDAVNKSDSWESLKALFPNRDGFRTGMYLLNDNVLGNRKMLKAAIWGPYDHYLEQTEKQAQTRLQQRAANLHVGSLPDLAMRGRRSAARDRAPSGL
mmetsp:Transcript_82940/g.173658  ORF Transcript_82940/g.173658 Transcript_82940/m.173658 type:complete len:286 (+) Transcript_82940:156-1013(+)|eukprot:CAMPEP_0206535738 /NCGR_PEP_ID=MMETSP0325_2-20121206/6325_1 /ASSEMBLY_ACC=CAM_ASM_000347 /TAXON_ID=2866 /ORGANISM="Crypthecodinium cohnii, Strain Seligo" /LENGTH=285 /DNA_ID=CAMNT_0054032801 /DNA_START=93 /DNA_END=950 /DNA_ORIENTATION=+